VPLISLFFIMIYNYLRYHLYKLVLLIVQNADFEFEALQIFTLTVAALRLLSLLPIYAADKNILTLQSNMISKRNVCRKKLKTIS